MKLKKYIMAAAISVSGLCASGEVLPDPQVSGGMPIMDAMAQRLSSRDIDSEQPVTKQDISNICWAAWGLTHDGKHTVGTAMNRQELTVYVITATEISRYNPEANTLTTIAKGDFRKEAGQQEFAQKAPVNIAFVVDTDKQKSVEYQGYTVGAASQNVYLYCASAGLKTVVRGMFDHEQLPKVMKLAANERVILVQTVGH